MLKETESMPGLKTRSSGNLSTRRRFLSFQTTWNMTLNPLNKSRELSIHPPLILRQTNEAENEQLSELRDWLLPMLMNGQITVGDNAENKASYKIEEEMRMAAEPEN